MEKPDTTTVNLDPRQYINKVSRRTGAVMDAPFSPEDLLVHALRKADLAVGRPRHHLKLFYWGCQIGTLELTSVLKNHAS